MDRRDAVTGFVARQKIDMENYFLIPDYRNDTSENDLLDFEFQEDEGEEEDQYNGMVKIPAHFEVCPTCHGKGKHVNPGIDSHGITQSEMDELGEDFREDYFAGHYDITCNECGGENVVLEPDENLNTQEKEVLEAYYRALGEEWSEMRYREMGIQF